MNALKECNTILEKEKNALDVKVTELEALVVGKECELTDLNSLISFVKSQNDILVDRFDNLYTDFVEMAIHLEEKFYSHLFTTVSGRKWLLTYGMKLVIVKCLNSTEYLSALGAAIGKAIKKGMQDRLSAGIVHGREDRLPNVNFSLLAELKSNKDASVKTVMDILRLEGPLAVKLGLNELQPDVDQLMVHIHRSSAKVVLSATALSLSLNVSNTEGTSDTAPATAYTNMALSTTFASTSSIAPISIDDYKVVGTEDQAVADENVASFPNVDDVEL
nr:hypothetical protein [Tanacetum cinerariifolium]